MLEIEIVETNIIDGGIEVFARAWNEKGQIGFGADGSVDIERFRIINPPVLIDDPDGNIVTTSNTENPTTGVITTTSRTLREDPEEAVLQSLEIIIKEVGKDSANIETGRRGNTTTTVYSDAGGDGDITSGGAVSFATARSGSGLSVDKVDNDGNVYIDNSVFIRRVFFPFDTASISSGDTILSAVLTLTHPNINQVNGGVSIGLTGSDQASLTDLTTSDWTITDDTRYSTDKADTDYGAANTTVAYTLNAAGISNVAKGSGFTKLCLRTQRDIDNSSASYGATYVDIYYSNETGTTRDPVLVIEHTASATRRIFNIS